MLVITSFSEDATSVCKEKYLYKLSLLKTRQPCNYSNNADLSSRIPPLKINFEEMQVDVHHSFEFCVLKANKLCNINQL